MKNIYRTTFPDGTVYISAKQKPPENAAKSFKWAEQQINCERPLVAAYLKSKGSASTEILHTNLLPEEAQELKAKYVAEAQSKKLNVIY
jgi:hypothetical protein